VFLGLLKSIAGGAVCRFGFHNGDGEIATVAKQVIGTLLLASDGPVAHDHNAPIGEAFLLTDLTVFPAGAIELRKHICSASVRFVDRHDSPTVSSSEPGPRETVPFPMK